MKALTLTQPWATLVAIGEKRYETRSWGTPHRGPLAIHAAKGVGPLGGQEAFFDLCLSEPFHSVLSEHGYADPLQLPRGGVVAVTELVICLPTETPLRELPRSIAAYEVDFGDWTPGRFAWALDEVRKVDPPVAARGALGLWEFDDRIVRPDQGA